MMKKSPIEWCDFTWNPVTGCRKSCPFCKGMDILLHFKGDNRLYLSSELIKKDKDKELFILAKPFPGTGTDVVPFPTGGFPTFHLYRLPMVTKKWKPANIYVCHNGDLFGDWVPTEWIQQVFEACQKAPWHNYMFLTMNPKRYAKLLEANLLIQADNFWYGTRLTEKADVFTADGYHSFVCIEPMGLFAERMEIPDVEWILLGGYGRLKRRWIESVMERRGDIPVFMISSNLFKEVWDAPLIQEYPPLLNRLKEKDLPRCSECKSSLKRHNAPSH